MNNGLFRFMLLGESHGEPKMRAGITRIVAESFNKMRDGFCWTVLLQQSQAQIEAQLWIGWFEPNGFGEMGQSLIGFALLGERDAQGAMRGDVARLKAQDVG